MRPVVVSTSYSFSSQKFCVKSLFGETSARASVHMGMPGERIGKGPVSISSPVIGLNSKIRSSPNPLTQKASVGLLTASPSGPPEGVSPGAGTDPDVPVSKANRTMVPATGSTP